MFYFNMVYYLMFLLLLSTRNDWGNTQGDSGLVSEPFTGWFWVGHNVLVTAQRPYSYFQFPV